MPPVSKLSTEFLVVLPLFLDLNNTKEIKIDKSQRGKGSMRILMDHSKKNAKEKTLPSRFNYYLIVTRLINKH